jgi:putative membrane protein
MRSTVEHILVAGAFAFLAMTPAHAQSKQSADRLAADNLFMTKAAQGGLAEVQMGELATDRASSPQVKRFGQRMVDDHSKANNELKHIASQKGETLPTTVSAKDKDVIDRLSKLSGTEFDRTYMQYMVDDHKEDTEEFKREANSGNDPQVKAFAAKTVPVLEGHLKMAEQTDREVKK